MAITHKQLQDVFEFDKINNSAYGIKSYKVFKSGVEVYAKKNELEVRIPGTAEHEIHTLEHLTLDDLKAMLPKWIKSAKKKAPKKIEQPQQPNITMTLMGPDGKKLDL